MQAHCTVCHEHFATVGISDKHQSFDDERRATCHPPAQVRTKKGERVYRLSEESEGPVWRSFARAPETIWGDR